MKKSFFLTSLVMLFSFSVAAYAIPAGKSSASKDGGSIAGKVTFAGPAPAPKKIEITKDVKICGKVAHFNEDLLVSKDKGLANVVVSLSEVEGGKSLDSWGTKFSLDQNGCQFVPHVILVPVGVKLKIKNSDGILHNIHTFSEENKPINKAQPRFLKVLSLSFDEPEIVRVACDVHNWMKSYIAVVDHPYYAVTDENGKFELTEVPDGTYTIEYWHESLGAKNGKVMVQGGAAVEVNFEFKKAK
ncbi:MAG: hypothetical protein ACE5IR_09955 [bacterium]